MLSAHKPSVLTELAFSSPLRYTTEFEVYVTGPRDFVGWLPGDYATGMNNHYAVFVTRMLGEMQNLRAFRSVSSSLGILPNPLTSTLDGTIVRLSRTIIHLSCCEIRTSSLL